ncbi:MAG: preprotein translocase subunit YajC [Acidimicrobiia bacterium]|nr:preprotein translocase subunit YajC [Acidimicrobiia bacterium]MBT8218002.1 preprotein translocase subunit YajC [Acidimicrobiia bacterium]NNF09478.1 preprotein translocase subunit YajC [Acidimicrobiia bacterium]NNL70182.1 preprotein translocase subunit YajC [Acidimicrobiia bacterium]
MFLIAQSSSESSGAINLLLIVVIFGGLFLFMSLRQRKRLRERNDFLDTIAVGDRVRTYGGVVGTIESMDDDEVVVMTEGTRLRLVKAAVAGRTDEQ